MLNQNMKFETNSMRLKYKKKNAIDAIEIYYS
jgi:hypothetical protein